MKIIPTALPEVRLIEPQVFGDARGFFMETWQASRYDEAGISGPFVQDNLSLSRRGILRGLHLQNPLLQGKLVYVLKGEVFDVAVDVRAGSPTFGRWVGEYLSAENKRQLWVPEGFAHGFCVTSDEALFAYKCTELYSPATELGIRWDDPRIAIDWPIERPTLSDKDKQARFLADIPLDRLPSYHSGGHR